MLLSGADPAVPGALEQANRTKVRPPEPCSFKSECAFYVVKRGAVKCSEVPASTCHFHPILGMDISRLELMVVMRSSNSLTRPFILFYLFIFPIIFSWEDNFSTTAQPDPFIRAVPSLFPLSLARFVVSCDDEDGTESDTICRPGCLPKRPLDDNRHDLILLLTLIALHTSPLTNPNAYLQPQPSQLPTPSKSP